MRRSIILVKPIIYILSFTVILSSCSTSGPAKLFGKRTPHEQYEDKINSAGLNETAMGKLWLDASRKSLRTPLTVNLPYSEPGYFPADQPKSVGLMFKAKRGEKLNINLAKRPSTGFALYLDFWQAPAAGGDAEPKLLLYADTSQSSLSYNVDKEGTFILRLQPELLKGGEYTLSISTGPSLGFPISPKVKSSIGSFWGDSRDNGGRRHEGIDIFAPKRAELVAAADGVVGRVEENTLGGKVIFLNPDNRDIALYYAHLDEQLARPGQTVKQGDVIGLVGNTGNARTSSPHLHFGIYTYSGAIDPLPFVSRENRTPEKITVPLSNINEFVRSAGKSTLYTQPSTKSSAISGIDANTLLNVEAATSSWYKVSLPSGEKGFVQGSNISSLSTAIKKVTTTGAVPVFDEPYPEAARKIILPSGRSLRLLASYRDFYYVTDNIVTGWIFKQVI